MADSSPQENDVHNLRIAMQRLGIGDFDDAWLARFADELDALLAMGSKLDELDLTQEEPSNIYLIPRSKA